MEEKTIMISSTDYKKAVKTELMLDLVKQIYESKFANYEKNEFVKMVLGVVEYSEPELKVM